MLFLLHVRLLRSSQFSTPSFLGSLPLRERHKYCPDSLNLHVVMPNSRVHTTTSHARPRICSVMLANTKASNLLISSLFCCNNATLEVVIRSNMGFGILMNVNPFPFDYLMGFFSSDVLLKFVDEIFKSTFTPAINIKSCPRIHTLNKSF